MAGSASLFGLTGYLLTRWAMIAPPAWVVSGIAPSDRARFMADWWAHNASYGVGFVGGIVLSIAQYRNRNLPSIKQTGPE